MLTGELRNQIDGIWNDFWSGGLANPLQVIEQITYLIFIKRLDEMLAREEIRQDSIGAVRVAVTAHPSAEWLARQLTEAYGWQQAPGLHHQYIRA
jgi:hypothetical protein